MGTMNLLFNLGNQPGDGIIIMIEGIIVALVIALQIVVLFITKRQINRYCNALPNQDTLSVCKTQVNDIQLESTPPAQLQKELLQDNHELITNYSNSQVPSNANVELSLIKTNARHMDPIYQKISTTINSYIIRSRNKALDFNMIQDIVDRQLHTLEDQIRPMVSLPLYLGLMTTMIGIIIGLFSMPNLATTMTNDFATNDVLLNQGITSLIGGVKIAMIASLVGLAMTTYLSTWTFRRAQQHVEQTKDDFYTFVQLELLPIINQSLPATISSLQDNLVKFNAGFRDNLASLSEVFGKNTEAIKAQKELFEALDREKIIAVSEHNVKVLQQLQQSTQRIEQLNLYFAQLDKVLHNSQLIVNVLQTTLDRTKSVETIAQDIQNNIADNRQVMDFIMSELDHIQSLRKDTRSKINEYNQDITVMFENLRSYTQENIRNIRQFTLDEYDAIKDALSGDRDVFRQLDELHHIRETLNHMLGMQQSLSSEREALVHLNELSSISQTMNEILAWQKSLPLDQAQIIAEQLHQLNQNQTLIVEKIGKFEEFADTIHELGGSKFAGNQTHFASEVSSSAYQTDPIQSASKQDNNQDNLDKDIYLSKSMASDNNLDFDLRDDETQSIITENLKPITVELLQAIHSNLDQQNQRDMLIAKQMNKQLSLIIDRLDSLKHFSATQAETLARSSTKTASPSFSEQPDGSTNDKLASEPSSLLVAMPEPPKKSSWFSWLTRWFKRS